MHVLRKHEEKEQVARHRCNAAAPAGSFRGASPRQPAATGPATEEAAEDVDRLLRSDPRLGGGDPASDGGPPWGTAFPRRQATGTSGAGQARQGEGSRLLCDNPGGSVGGP